MRTIFKIANRILSAFLICTTLIVAVPCTTTNQCAYAADSSQKKLANNTETKDSAESVSDESGDPTDPADSDFSIRFIDVGQGDAALIQCEGHYMLIDGGPAEESSKIYSILKQNDINQLDYMIATHPDADHIGGLSGALNYANVGTCYCSVKNHDTKTFKSLVKYLKKQNLSITIPRPDDKIMLGSATLTFLAPIPYTNAEIEENINDSIVVKIDYGKNSFLFMADAEAEEENQILNRYKKLNCDVLKVAHHGSHSSTSSKFLNATKPQYAIISVGKDNSYGHPTQEVLDALVAAKASVFRTDLHGDITVISDGKDITVLPEKSPDPLAVIGAKIQKEAEPGITYVLNKNTKKFHYPTCKSVFDIKPKNRKDVTLTREEIIEMGYVPCKRCHP